MSGLIDRLTFFGLLARMIGNMDEQEKTLRELVASGRKCGLLEVKLQQAYLDLANFYASQREGFEGMVPDSMEFSGPVPVPGLDKGPDDK